VLPRPGGGVVRRLIADTGAGNVRSPFQLLMDEADCLQSAGILVGRVQLGGAFAGQFPVYSVPVQVPALNFADPVPIVGVAAVPHGFDGIAAFRFLNRFHYGNFGDPDSFGLEV